MNAKQKAGKDKLLKELAKTPIIQIATQKMDISRATYYRWRKSDNEFRRAADEAIELGVGIVNDLAESQLISGIQQGEFQATTFWLKNRHPAYKPELKIDGPKLGFGDVIASTRRKMKEINYDDGSEDFDDVV